MHDEDVVVDIRPASFSPVVSPLAMTSASSSRRQTFVADRAVSSPAVLGFEDGRAGATNDDGAP